MVTSLRTSWTSSEHTVLSGDHLVRKESGVIPAPKVTLGQWAHQDAMGRGDQKERKARKVNKCIVAEGEEEALGFKGRAKSVLHRAASLAAQRFHVDLHCLTAKMSLPVS